MDDFVKNDECPVCLGTLDCATDVRGDARPKPGDLSVCIHCSSALVFDEGLNLRAATQDDLDSLPDHVRALLDATQGAAVALAAANPNNFSTRKRR